RPYHLLISALRATGANVSDWLYLWYHTYNLGQAPFEWKPPNGYPDSVDFWAGLILQRWNFVFWLLNNEVPNAAVDVSALKSIGTADGIADRINVLCFGGDMPVQDRRDLISFLQSNPHDETRIRDAVGLALASPGFQWY